MKGFSPTNLKYMRLFAEAWPDFEDRQQPVDDLPWGHNLVLLTRLKARNARLAYAHAALAHGWSTSPLGVSEYRLVESLPKDLEANLPSIELIEQELNKPPISLPSRTAKRKVTKVTRKGMKK